MVVKRLRSLKRAATNTGGLRERAIAHYHELLARDETLTPSTFEKLRSAMRKNRLPYGDRPIGIALRPHLLVDRPGVACWPCRSTSCALCGMLTYSSLATLGLLYLALGCRWNGPLLWPAVILHALLTLLLARAWLKPRGNRNAAAQTRRRSSNPRGYSIEMANHCHGVTRPPRASPNIRS